MDGLRAAVAFVGDFLGEGSPTGKFLGGRVENVVERKEASGGEDLAERVDFRVLC